MQQAPRPALAWQEKLSVLGHSVFLDSDNLMDLTKIKQHVRHIPEPHKLLSPEPPVACPPNCLGARELGPDSTAIQERLHASLLLA